MEIHNIMNNTNQKSKFKVNIMTKCPSRKQTIIPMGTNNAKRVIIQANTHITNINRAFKEVKSNIFTNYIYSDNREVIITTNKIATSLDLSMVEKYMKELNDVDSNNIMSPRLSQSSHISRF